MVKYLDNLLPSNGFLNVSVQCSYCCLLGSIIFPASASYRLYCLHHDRNHHYCNQSQPDIGIQHQAKSAYNADGSRNQLNHCVIEHFPYSIHIIGKTAHSVTMVMGIVITYRKLLKLLKQIITELADCILRYSNHNSLLQILCHYPNQINTQHSQNSFHKECYASFLRCQTIDDWA